jgi:hypothetical protein
MRIESLEREKVTPAKYIKRDRALGCTNIRNLGEEVKPIKEAEKKISDRKGSR